MKKSEKLDDRMKAIYEDMVGGPDLSEKGISAQSREYMEKREAELAGQAQQMTKADKTKKPKNSN